MTTFSNFSSIFVPLTGLVFLTITMVYLFLHLQRKKFF